MYQTIHTMKKRDERGFTLVELLIVIAIIAILAAIALPQFAAYRMRGFNASANSDVRNAATTQEAMFADTQGYGMLHAAAAVIPAAPANCAASGNILAGAQPAATVTIAGAFIENARGAVGLAISNGVTIGMNTAVTGTTPVNTCDTYTLAARHGQADRCFGRDSDTPNSYAARINAAPAALVIGDVPASTIGVDTFNGATTGLCANWAAQ